VIIPFSKHDLEYLRRLLKREIQLAGSEVTIFIFYFEDWKLKLRQRLYAVSVQKT